MKNDQQISSPNQGRGTQLGGKGTTAPISLKIIGASAGISNPLPTTLGIYHEEKQKTRIMTIKTRTTTNKMLDAMY